MSNHNEEIQILSHENDSHIDSNDSLRQKSGGVSGENNIQIQIKENKAINENLNIGEFQQNNNIEQNKTVNIKINNNNINNMQAKLQNFGPHIHNRNFGMHPYNQHHHHFHSLNSHNHNVSPVKLIFYYIYGYLQNTNNRIINLYTGLTTTLNMLLIKSKLPPSITRKFHIKQILFIIYIINIQYLLSSIEKIPFLNYLNKASLKYFIFSVIGLYVHYYFYSNKLFLQKDEELEKFIIKKNPQMKKGRCEHCGLIRVCRCNHCFFCNKCVKKFQLHSDWFNICIGSNNELLYALTIFFANVYLFISNIIYWYYILIRSDILNFLLLIFTLFAIVGFYILFNTLRFLYFYVFEIIFANLTIYEYENVRRMMYLWTDERRYSFFNPFNKGLKRNIEEMFVNLFDIDIYSDYKNFINLKLSEIIDDDKINQQEEEFNEFDEISSYKMMIKLVEHFDPLITSKGNIYKFVDGKEIINWNRLMIFTPFDIINCPFKEMMINRAKMMLKQRDLYLEQLHLQKINQNIENVEKIDNTDNTDKNENNENNENNDNIKNNENKDNDINKENENNNDNNSIDNSIDNIIEKNENEAIHEDKEKLKNEE